MGPVAPSASASEDLNMDFKDHSSSTNWISLINTVFASIAVLPVFLVWFLGIITDSIEEKENQDDRVIIVEENDNQDDENNKPFNWPADQEVLEGLRKFQNQRTEISEEMRSKLADIGILRDADTQAEISAGKIESKARLSGKSLSRKQVHVFWDTFASKSRPGLPHGESSPDQSPSPKSRKPLKKINLEKDVKMEGRLKQRKFWNNTKNQNNVLVRAF